MSEIKENTTDTGQEPPFHGVLRAVLVADAAGYSRLMPEDPAGTIASLKRHRQRMRDIVRRHGGRDAGFPGDYLLALFTGAGDALTSAMEFLEQADLQGASVPLQFRVGLHVGDVFEQSGDALGVAINIASRLQQSAPVGGIVMSHTFRESLPGRLQLPVQEIGPLRLKNVAEPVHAYELRLPVDAAPAPSPQAAAVQRPARRRGESRPRIYIRPFRALGKAERALVFADGLVEELVTTLGMFSDVFRTVQATTAEAGEDGFEIAGQVRNGDRLRITCHLVDRSSGDTLWADRFDFGNDASYDAQERIAVAVITALQLKLTDGETARLWSNRPTSLAAWEHFHRGRMCEARYTSESNALARTHFSRAVALDPGFVAAIVGLGFNHLDAVRLGWSVDRTADLARAFELAERAIAGDRYDPYAMSLLAYVQRAQGRQEEALATMASAVRIAPRNGEMVAYYAGMLWMQGDAAEAVLQNRRALELTPQPGSWMKANLGLALLWDKRPAEAQSVFEQVIAADPDYVRAHIGLVVALVRQSKTAEAKAVYRALMTKEPGFRPDSWNARDPHFRPADTDAFLADLHSVA